MPEGVQKGSQSGNFPPFRERGGIHHALLQVLFEQTIFPNGNGMDTFEFPDHGGRTELI